MTLATMIDSQEDELRTVRWWDPNFHLGVGYAQNARDCVACLPHTHGAYTLLICLQGKMEFVLGRACHVLTPGELIVHNSGEIHQSWYGTDDSPCDYLAFYLQPEFLYSLLGQIFRSRHLDAQTVVFLGKRKDQDVIQLTDELANELPSCDVGHEALMYCLATKILLHLLRHCLEPTSLRTGFRLPRQLPIWEMNRAMQYMRARGKKHFSVAEMCRAVGTSQSRFVSLFRNSTGLSPHSYFNRLLVTKAQRFLRLKYPIKEVAYQLGFRDSSHFTRVFGRVTGVAPGTYREEILQQ